MNFDWMRGKLLGIRRRAVKGRHEAINGDFGAEGGTVAFAGANAPKMRTSRSVGGRSDPVRY